MDLNAQFVDGERILGDGKTIRGFLAGVSAGVVTAALEEWLSPWQHINWFWMGSAAALGAMVGDVVGSFIKRRLKMRGATPVLDQIPFILFSLVFAYPFAKTFITILDVIIIVAITYCLHIVMNKLAYRMGWKKVPW